MSKETRLSRRDFLKLLGGSAAVAAGFAPDDLRAPTKPEAEKQVPFGLYNVPPFIKENKSNNSLVVDHGPLNDGGENALNRYEIPTMTTPDGTEVDMPIAVIHGESEGNVEAVGLSIMAGSVYSVSATVLVPEGASQDPDAQRLPVLSLPEPLVEKLVSQSNNGQLHVALVMGGLKGVLADSFSKYPNGVAVYDKTPRPEELWLEVAIRKNDMDFSAKFPLPAGE